MSANDGMTIVEFLEARLADDERAAYDLMGEREGDRTLAECSAKRAILEMHATYAKAVHESVGIAWVGARCGREVAADALKALASVYKGHPDYQQEWANDM